MTAERPGGEWHTPSAELTASPANAKTPAVSFCLGFYIVKGRYESELDICLAECDICGVTGPAGHRCEQTVIS